MSIRVSNTDFPSMGATIFFGLTIVALLGHKPSNEAVNPQDTHRRTNFTQDRSDVDMTPFVAWALPLGFDDADPNGRDGPLTTPVAAIVPSGAVQVGPQHGPFQAQITPTEIDAAPDAPDVQVILSVQDRSIVKADTSFVSKDVGTALPRALPQPDPTVSVLATGPNMSAAPTPIERGTDPSAASGPNTVDPEIARRFVSIDPPASDTNISAPRAPYVAQVAGNLVHLRSLPVRGAPSLGRFNIGTPAVALEVIGDWALVTIDDTLTGWMFAEFVEALPDPIEQQGTEPGAD